MNIEQQNTQTISFQKLIFLAIPITISYFLYQQYANTQTYVKYLDFYVKQAVAVLNNWLGESVEFQRGILASSQEAAIVSQTDFNYVFMNTDQDPLFVLVVILTVIFAWPSSWVSKVVGALFSVALMGVSAVASLTGLFFLATHYPLSYAEIKEWGPSATLFTTAVIFILCYVRLAGEKRPE